MLDPRALVPRYYLYRMTNSAGFYVPVAILYLRDRGLGMDFVLFSYAVFSFATLAAEVPTGYLGDWLGRRASLALGALTRAVVLLAYPLVAAPAAYLGLHVLWAVGRSFRSGTQDAWLYELLRSRGDEDRFAHVEGRGSTVLLVASAVGAVLGGVLYGVDPAYPFLVTAGLAVLGVPLLFTFPAVGADSDADGGGGAADDRAGDVPADDTFTVREALGVLRVQVRRPEVRWLVAYAALFNALFLVTRIYEQPALRSVGVPVAGLGVLYAAFKLVSAGAASTAGWLDDRLGPRGVFALLVPVYGLAYAGLAVVPALVVPALFMNRGLRVVTRPIRNRYLNDRLDDVGRATVLSGAAMALAFAGGIARIVAGWVAPLVGPVEFLAWSGVAVASAGAVLWLAVSPIRSGVGRRVTGGAAPGD